MRVARGNRNKTSPVVSFAIEIGIGIEIVAPDLYLAKAQRTPRNFRWDISIVRRDIPRSEGR